MKTTSRPKIWALLALGALVAAASQASSVAVTNRSSATIYFSLEGPENVTVIQQEIEPGGYQRWKTTTKDKFTGTWKVEADIDKQRDGLEEVGSGLLWWSGGKNDEIEWGEFNKAILCPLKANNAKTLSDNRLKTVKVVDKDC